MWRQVRRGRWQNADASNRAERPILYLVCGVALVALLAYLAAASDAVVHGSWSGGDARHDGGVRVRHAMDQSVAAHGVRHAGRHGTGAHAIPGRLRAAAGAAGAWCGRVSRSSGTTLPEVALGTFIGAAARLPRCTICDCAARPHSSRERCGRGGVSRGRRAEPRASPSVGAGAHDAGGVPRVLVEAPGSRAVSRIFIWLDEPRELVGVVNLSEIVHGCFRSAYLGYYAFVPYAGRGLDERGSRAGHHARVQDNEAPPPRGQHSAPQPAVESAREEAGFRREGFSPRYLKINGRWRDHERWAILSEDW